MSATILITMLKFLIIALMFSTTISFTIPSYVHLCKRNDPELAKCVTKTIHDIKPYLSTNGIPEMNLPPLEPFKIESFKFRSGDNANNFLDVGVIDLEMENLSSYNVTKYAVDLSKAYFSTDVVFKNVKGKGKYTVKGKVMFFTLDGEGDVALEIGEVIAHAEWYGTSFKKNDREHFNFKLDRSNITADLKDFSVHLGNVFKDKALTDNFNLVMNQNIDVLIPEFAPIVYEAVSLMSLEYLNDVYDVFPVDVLFPND